MNKINKELLIKILIGLGIAVVACYLILFFTRG